jgi:kynurenine formamidase
MAAEPKLYAESTVVQFLGRRVHVLDMSHELAPSIPVYPGHMKVAFWDHITHAESRLRLGDTPFRGYAVKGISLCDHDSTHVDAIYHFNPDRPDLTIDAFPIDYCFTDAVWVDVSDVALGGYITLER